MKRVFVCFLVLGLTVVSLGSEVAYDNVGAESKDVSSKVSGSSSLSSYVDKRGAAKITNTDNPGFNHLTTSTSSSTGFKPSSGQVTNTPPFKYLYNQFYQPNPYLTYVQLPQAAQIAAQYAFQPNPVAHYFQTPNQIQYVSTPTVAQLQQPIKYQTFSGEYSNTDKTTASSGSSAQYVAPSQTSQYSGSTAQVSASAASSTQSKPVQVPLYSNFQATQPFYYQQTPQFYFLTQPQINPNFIYQQPNANFLLKNQQQYLNFYGGNRFGFYTPTQNNQLTYMVPIPVAATAQEHGTTTTDSKTSEKAATSSPLINSYSSYGTKA